MERLLTNPSPKYYLGAGEPAVAAVDNAHGGQVYCGNVIGTANIDGKSGYRFKYLCPDVPGLVLVENLPAENLFPDLDAVEKARKNDRSVQEKSIRDACSTPARLVAFLLGRAGLPEGELAIVLDQVRKLKLDGRSELPVSDAGADPEPAQESDDPSDAGAGPEPSQEFNKPSDPAPAKANPETDTEPVQESHCQSYDRQNQDAAPEADELLDVYDENLNKTGTASRLEVHEKSLMHMTVRVWMVRDGKITFQLRAGTKSLFPGKLDPVCTGHVAAGETPRDAALREIFEETGIKPWPEDLIPAGRIPFPFQRPDGKLDNEIANLFLWAPGSRPKLQATPEVDRWIEIHAGHYDDMIHGKRQSVPTKIDGRTAVALNSEFCSLDPEEWRLVKKAANLD